MKALFVGAGASCGTFNGTPTCPPVAKHFGKALSEAAPTWEHEYPGLREVVTHLRRPLVDLGLEEIWTCIDYHAKLSTALWERPQWDPPATWDLKRAILRLYGSRCDDLADRLEWPSACTLACLLSQLSPGDILISFNYDTIAERLAARSGHDIRSAFSSCDRGIVRLAKPHGSVSWRMDWGTRRVVAVESEGRPVLAAMRPEEVGPAVEPLVLGAVPIKSELLREVQISYGWPDVFELVAQQWRLIGYAVRHAESFVVAGYSFPNEDQYGRFLLREAMRGRRSLPTVEFYELPYKQDDTKKAILDAFQCPGLDPMPKGPVQRGSLAEPRM